MCTATSSMCEQSLYKVFLYKGMGTFGITKTRHPKSVADTWAKWIDYQTCVTPRINNTKNIILEQTATKATMGIKYILLAESLI